MCPSLDSAYLQFAHLPGDEQVRNSSLLLKQRLQRMAQEHST